MCGLAADGEVFFMKKRNMVKNVEKSLNINLLVDRDSLIAGGNT